MAAKNVKLKHVDGGRQIEVSADLVDMYRSQGWVVAPVTAAKKVAAKSAAEASVDKSATA